MAASRTLMALAIAATMVVELAIAANYTVGDSGGWEMGSAFQSWASSKNFTVGDVLIFQYSPNHDVLEVNESDLNSCSARNPIQKHTDGNTAITLLTSGKRFFICGVPGHCLAGMKVAIDTLANPSPPPSSTDTPPAPTPEATPSSPPPTSTPSPPPTSTLASPTSPPASPPKAATKPPAKSPLAPPPDSKASPPAPPPELPPPSPTPESEPSIPPFPFDQPLTPSAAPTTPPPPPSSAYKCNFRVQLSVGFSFVVIMLLAL